MLSRLLGARGKAVAKEFLHRSGTLRAARSLSARNALTIVLFHRVLPKSDPRAKAADWTYTVQLEHYERFLDFIRGAYNIVSLKQVEDAYLGSAPLPEYALLITFDDAWEDTARYAVPALEKRKLPSAIFVPTGAIGDELRIWPDVAAMLWRAGTLKVTPDGSLQKDVEALGRLSDADRTARLREALARAGDAVAPVMMSPQQYRDLPTSVELGGHGVNHIRFTDLENVEGELTGARDALRTLTGKAPRSFAFPHGSYHLHHVGEAHKAGYDLVFTTDAAANKLVDGRPASPVLCRITIYESEIVDGGGRFSESEVAYSLFDRPAKTLADDRAA